jgi:uncharacterized protein
LAIKSKYYIDIQSLKEGTHHFNFEVDELFFSQRPDSLLQKAEVTVGLTLKKTSTMLEARFDLSGWFELECDRSLKLFREPFSTQEQIVFKLGDEYKELSEDVVVIPRESQGIDLDPLFYDFVSLQVPMKKIHPDLRNEEANEQENLVVFRSEEAAEKDENENKEVDPRWAKLQLLNQK